MDDDTRYALGRTSFSSAARNFRKAPSRRQSVGGLTSWLLLVFHNPLAEPLRSLRNLVARSVATRHGGFAGFKREQEREEAADAVPAAFPVLPLGAAGCPLGATATQADLPESSGGRAGEEDWRKGPGRDHSVGGQGFATARQDLPRARANAAGTRSSSRCLLVPGIKSMPPPYGSPQRPSVTSSCPKSRHLTRPSVLPHALRKHSRPLWRTLWRFAVH